MFWIFGNCFGKWFGIPVKIGGPEHQIHLKNENILVWANVFESAI